MKIRSETLWTKRGREIVLICTAWLLLVRRLQDNNLPWVCAPGDDGNIHLPHNYSQWLLKDTKFVNATC